jgi:hypothetical protein
MSFLFAIFLVLHGALHLMGAAKAFQIAAMPRLTQPISPSLGALWLLAAGLLFATAWALFAWPRWWWALGAGAVVSSQLAIATSWHDAKYGSIANVVGLAGVVLGALSRGPTSFRAQYERDVEQGIGRAVAMPVLTEADLEPLPAAVQRYIRLTGAIGMPRVQNFRARFHGKIRSGRDARWVPFTGEQCNFYDQPSRFFLMNASMFGVPFQAFHRFVGASATMRVNVASLVPMVDAKGPAMNESETVTLFNDLCIFAPGALVDRSIQWQEIDPYTVSASFTKGRHTIRATLVFNERGELKDFVSDDRSAASKDGQSFAQMRWSTPLHNYRRFGPHLIMSEGEGVWHAPTGTYTYLHFDLDAIEYNLTAAPRPQRR